MLSDPRALRLKLAPRRPFSDTEAVAKMKIVEAKPGTDPVEWGFLQAFAPADEKSDGRGEQAAVYVHPLLKCSASFLSGQSLEMCTELLGSETGSDVGDGEAPLLSPGGGGPGRRPAIRTERMKLSRSSSFPPPLTLVGGSTGVQVRSRREGGRLVVEAVEVPSGRSFFHVERSHGRLRVRFSEESEAGGEEEEEAEAEAEAESEEGGGEEEEEEEEEEENVWVEGEDIDHEEFEEEEGEGMEGNGGFVEGSWWCNEGAAMNWKPRPCWVAT